MEQPFRAVLVGVDGSGKTSVVSRLRERVGVEGTVATLNSPIYHETPNAPLRHLSRQMHAVSLAADSLGLPELKAAMLYLQMTMYGIVESSVVAAFEPRLLVSDRHALVDTLAYGPLYKHMLGTALDPDRWEPALREQLADAVPHALDATIAWHERVARRLEIDVGFWELPHEVGAQFDRPFDAVVAEFSRRYGVGLPDAVVLLDVDPAEALRRSSGRTAPSSELHEREGILAKLREIYDRALATLERERPEVAVHRVEVSELSVEETLEAALACLPAGLAPGLAAR